MNTSGGIAQESHFVHRACKFASFIAQVISLRSSRRSFRFVHRAGPGSRVQGPGASFATTTAPMNTSPHPPRATRHGQEQTTIKIPTTIPNPTSKPNNPPRATRHGQQQTTIKIPTTIPNPKLPGDKWGTNGGQLGDERHIILYNEFLRGKYIQGQSPTPKCDAPRG
jgi:hypothetical protein